jgi:CRISPR-associated exonuclease Cas4
MALRFASNKEQASYVLAVTTIVWTLAASYRLQRALISNNEAQILAAQNNLSSETKIAYSDDEESSSLLIDESTGLRGRPDQIVIIDSEFIPVEQKTGRVPKKPHDSHVMQALAYAALVETTTSRAPPYALLRYGPDNLHQIEWDDASKTKLFDGVRAIQSAMAQGGAHRNHERPGKCKNCSRRYACDQRLV